MKNILKSGLNIYDKKEFVIFISLILILLLPNIVFIIAGITLQGSLYKRAGYLILSTVVVLLPFLFLKRKTAFIISGILLLVAPFELWSVIYNGLPLNAGHITHFFQTNTNEAFEFIGTYYSIILVYVAVVFLYYTLVFRGIENQYLFKRNTAVGFIIILIVAVFSLFLYGYVVGYNIRSKKSDKLIFAYEALNKKFTKIYPLSFFCAISEGLNIQKEITTTSEEIKDFVFNAHKRSPDKSKEIYVLVIGETARYLNFGINGYDRNTTPNLSEIENLLSYTNLYSEANTTQISLPILLTRATATEFNVQKKEKSIVEAFKESGFYTYWIANQSFNYPFVQRILKNTDEIFISTHDIESAENYDEKLLFPLQTILNSNANKLFIAIHSLGSHFRYNFRYPPEFEVFKPAFKGSFDYGLINSKNKQLLINSYDNSILYTDYFLSEIIQMLQEIPDASSVMLYTSDHGENLYDLEKLVLHGGTNPSKYEIHVPLFIWFSTEYKNKYPQKVNEMYNNRDKKISSSVVFHSMLDIADIETEGEQLNKSISSPELINDSVRFVLNPLLELISEKDL